MVNQYYWYRMRAEIGASNMHSEITYFAPQDPGYVLDISPAAVLKSSTHQAAAQKFLAYLVSDAGPGDHRPLDQLRVPDRLGRDHGPARDPVRPAAAEPDHHRRAGRRLDGHRPAASRPGCCDARADRGSRPMSVGTR